MSSDLPRIRMTYDTVAERYAEEFGDELAENALHRGIVDCYAAVVAESGVRGPVVDVGCGPGHVTKHLADRGLPAIGVDLSPEMIRVARERHPLLDFRVGSMTQLEVPDASCAGLVSMYSIIHLAVFDRARAYREFGRALRPSGWVLVSFHVESAATKAGEVVHVEEWWGQKVDLDGYFLSPEEVAAGLDEAGIAIEARFDREPRPGIEYPSRRTYLLGRRRA